MGDCLTLGAIVSRSRRPGAKESLFSRPTADGDRGTLLTPGVI
jgi:hypothetical protein